MDFKPLRNIPQQPSYNSNDVMVLFGELFARGYANGIVEEAEKVGMKVIRATVGRRDSEGQLRSLTPEEVSLQPKPFINVPLEAGFDLQPSKKGNSPADQLAGVKINDWDKVELDWEQVRESRDLARESFKTRVRAFLKELEAHVKPGQNVLFVHTMAGGVPRAKIMMPTLNKVFKVRGDKFTPSETFWKSDIGRLCEMNFSDVTALTFQILIEESSKLRSQWESQKQHVSYVAYGYHGTEILINGKYQWQTYSPYIQGWAKIELENYAVEAYKKGINACVFNCPEILTNSSSIFQGIELPLFPLMGALRKEGADSKNVQKILDQCQSKLKPDVTIDKILDYTSKFVSSPVIQAHCIYNKWPQHNSRPQMELMVQSSDELQSWHKEEKDLCNFILSEEVFKATGTIMFHEGYQPRSPVWWIGHDLLSRVMAHADS